MNEPQRKLTEQVRQAVRDCGLSRYAIWQLTGVDQATLSRFVNGERGLSMEALDALGDALGIQITAKGESMKAYDRNTKDFRQLTLPQMRASIAAMQRHLNDAKRVYAQKKQQQGK